MLQLTVKGNCYALKGGIWLTMLLHRNAAQDWVVLQKCYLNTKCVDVRHQLKSFLPAGIKMRIFFQVF